MQQEQRLSSCQHDWVSLEDLQQTFVNMIASLLGKLADSDLTRGEDDLVKVLL
jgi:hypothetical protein